MDRFGTVLTRETFNLATCRGRFNCSLAIKIKPAESFELIWDKTYVNGDEDRIYHSLFEGAKNAFSSAKCDDHYRIQVVEIKDFSGGTPPAAFRTCVEQAISKALGKKAGRNNE
ncbi:MAG TPA: hypothetical protein VF268_10845 [Gammaproteobacteria bacterium]